MPKWSLNYDSGEYEYIDKDEAISRISDIRDVASNEDFPDAFIEKCDELIDILNQITDEQFQKIVDLYI